MAIFLCFVQYVCRRTVYKQELPGTYKYLYVVNFHNGFSDIILIELQHKPTYNDKHFEKSAWLCTVFYSYHCLIDCPWLVLYILSLNFDRATILEHHS